MKETLKSWYENLSSETIELLVDKSVKADVEEWLGVDKVHTNQEGKIKATFNLPIDKVLVGKILSFGNKVKVESPKTLKTAIKSAVLEISKLY